MGPLRHRPREGEPVTNHQTVAIVTATLSITIALTLPSGYALAWVGAAVALALMLGDWEKS